MPKKPEKLPDNIAQIAKLMREQADELISQHLAEAMEILEDTESKKVNISFGVEIDASEPAVTVKTKIGFAKKITDSRQSDIDDPNQPNLIEKENNN